jgi:hypothetical protein
MSSVDREGSSQAFILPLDTNILSLTVMATTMPFVGRGRLQPAGC